MRKFEQRKVLDIIDTLKSAQSVGLYADCQECALAVGEYIEKIQSEGTQTVALIEDYCELLFRVNNGEENPKSLHKALFKVISSIHRELKPDKFEVAFISHKASMSDSIESIYLAAKADLACNAYFIPVPYYEVGSDNSLIVMKYEGAEYYGNNIEVTDYRSYDIEAHHPDIIFTFNGYDELNIVTQVHPDYFCRRLRECTDWLIYSPYFVGTGDVHEHFCTIPGCVYAHRVVVQSKKVRDTYIRAFKQAFGNRFGRPEDKFLALGSPKFDKILSTRREDCDLLDEWAQIIKGKKVILWNTSVGAMLQNSERYLIKLRTVIDTFCGRNDVVLWWRPHPLSEATFAGMRPEMLGQYRALVNEFQERCVNLHKSGIMDISADLHRAIAISDGMLSDASSLVAMYEVTWKPLMMQEISNGHDKPKAKAIPFSNYYDDGEYFWFVPMRFNALFKMDKHTWKADYAGSFPNEYSREGALYECVIECGENLYFPPVRAAEIGVFNKCSGTFSKVPIDSHFCSADKTLIHSGCRFLGGVNYDGILFFTPTGTTDIVRYDVENNSMSYYSDWTEQLKGLWKHPKETGFGYILINKNEILLPVLGAPAVLVFNMDTCASEVFQVGSRNSGYSSICSDGENYWLAPRYTDSLVKWNRAINEWTEYDNIDGSYSNIDLCYMNIVYVNGYVWMFPYLGKRALKMNIKTLLVEVADEFQHECDKEKSPDNYSVASYYFAAVSGDTIYARTGKSNTLLAYDTRTGERREEQILLTAEYSKSLAPLRNEMLMDVMKNNGHCVVDSSLTDLNGFLDFVVSIDKPIKADVEVLPSGMSAVNADGTAGKKIYDYVKSLVLSNG